MQSKRSSSMQAFICDTEQVARAGTSKQACNTCHPTRACWTWRMKRHQARREPLRSVGKLPHDGKVRSQSNFPACERIVRVALRPCSSRRVSVLLSIAY